MTMDSHSSGLLSELLNKTKCLHGTWYRISGTFPRCRLTARPPPGGRSTDHSDMKRADRASDGL